MVDFNKEPEKPRQSSIGRGIRDTRLIERALREQWNIPDDCRPEIVQRQIEIAKSTECSPRESTSAARCLVSMQQQNQEAALKALDKSVPDLHDVSGAVEQRLTVEDLLATPDYLEYLRERERDSEPGPVCTNGHAGNGKPLANGDARNGH